MSGVTKLFIVTLLISGLMGCATNAPKVPDYFSTEYQSQALKISRVALVTDSTPPEIDGIDLGFTKPEGAAGGAAVGVLAGAASSLHFLGGCSGDYICGAAVLLLLPVFVTVGTIAGAVSGADSGYAADMLAEAEANAQQMLNSAYLQTELLGHAKDYGHDNIGLEFILAPSANLESLVNVPGYKPLSNESFDAVLEVELLRLTLKYSLEMEARARLISTHTGAVLSDSQYNFSSEHHSLDEWMAAGAAPLMEAIQRGQASVTQRTAIGGVCY